MKFNYFIIYKKYESKYFVDKQQIINNDKKAINYTQKLIVTFCEAIIV